MYKTLLITILLLISFFPNQFCQDNKTSTGKDKIKKKLEKITIDNLKSWEPPFYEEEMLKPFAQDKDLSIIIDGFPIKGYEQWKKIVYESMQEDRSREFKKYQDVVKELRTSVLSKNSGSVTAIYVWDYVTKENVHHKIDSTVTLVFKKIKGQWKIIQFHCSHGRDRIVSE